MKRSIGIRIAKKNHDLDKRTDTIEKSHFKIEDVLGAILMREGISSEQTTNIEIF